MNNNFSQLIDITNNTKFNITLKYFCFIFFFLISFFLTSFISSRPQHYKLTKVVIDAGHGGHDSGCLGETAKEKDIALAIALRLGKYISDNFKDVQVIYTRSTDIFIELHERAEIANNAKADLFICVHCNSACVYNKKKRKNICNEESHGVETWVMGLHKSEANLAVAKRENEAVLLEKDYQKKYDGFDPNSPEANIIFSLYQNTFLDQSLRFASEVEEEIKVKAREPRGVKQAGFLVLYKTYMPSVLIETGFLSNRAEEKYLMSEKGQNQMAHAIFNAFKNYKNSVELGVINDAVVHEKENNISKDTSKKIIIPVVLDTGKMKIDSTALYKNNQKDTMIKAIEVKPDTSQKEIQTEKNPIVIEKENENDEPVFSVQLVSSQKKLLPADLRFKGVKLIWEDIDNGMFKYVTGKLKTIDEALMLRKQMQVKGFQDAFVVAFKNSKRISMNEARELLKKNQSK